MVVVQAVPVRDGLERVRVNAPRVWGELGTRGWRTPRVSPRRQRALGKVLASPDLQDAGGGLGEIGVSEIHN